MEDQQASAAEKSTDQRSEYSSPTESNKATREARLKEKIVQKSNGDSNEKPQDKMNQEDMEVLSNMTLHGSPKKKLSKSHSAATFK